MTGSVQIKNDKYYMVINSKDANGKRHQKWISTDLEVKGNKRKAEQKLREYLTEITLHKDGQEHDCGHKHEQGRGQESERHDINGDSYEIYSSDVLFSEYVMTWMASIKEQVEPNTYKSYESVTNTHVLPYFNKLDVTLFGMTWEILQKYFDEKRDKGRIDGNGGLSSSSLRKIRNIVNQSLNDAVKYKLIPSNPCEFVKLPKTQRYESGYYNSDQMNKLLEAIKNEELYSLVKITATYGLRRSEVLGLKWDSIDFKANIITIKHTVVEFSVRFEKDKTKNASSHRSFPLAPEIRRLLLELKSKEVENRKLFGNQYIDTDYIFKWANGKPYEPNFISHKFIKLLDRYNLPRIRFHELRHSCASVLIAQGFSLKDVQEWLGHSDIQMTANIYSHLDIARKQTIANNISKMFSESC